MAAEQDLTPAITRSAGDMASRDAAFVKTGVANEEQQKSGFSGLSSQIAKNKGLDSSPGQGVQSIFNDFYVVKQTIGNYPVLETDEPQDAEGKKNFRGTSFKDLIVNPAGARIYKAADFVYCARHGMPINRMITLRRFAYPVLNDITDPHEQPDPDIARLVTYMDANTNPIMDLLKFSWKLKWEEMNSKIENLNGQLHGDQSGMDGFMGSILQYLDPVAANNAFVGEHQLAYDPYADTSKIYGPKDSIAKTTLRDVGLETEMEFQITFDYELRSINGVNQKRAFIDLLANILACTYNDGEFWGGARYWTGKRPAWNLMNKLRMTSPRDFNDFLAKGQESIRKVISTFSTNGGQAALDILAQVASNALLASFGKMLDKFGRVSIPQFNSLLCGEPTGSWHLTFGNPLNPIMSIGNLILTNTEFGFDTNEMSYDDLPEKFHVTCTLKTGMPLDRSGVEQIFNVSPGRIYWTPSKIVGVETSGGTSKTAKQFGDYGASAINNVMDQVFKFLDNKPSGLSKFAANVANNMSQTNMSPSSESTATNSLIEEQNRINAQLAATGGFTPN